jgi:hypothetical protein
MDFFNIVDERISKESILEVESARKPLFLVEIKYRRSTAYFLVFPVKN